jgi:hypothetical protein
VDPGGRFATRPLRLYGASGSGLVMAIGPGIAVILAVSVSAQTYLSMLGHGHSFHRILLWHVGASSFWGFAAPFVIRATSFVSIARPS